MKKLLCFIMVFTLACSIFAGCGCEKKYAPDDVSEIEKAKENAPVIEREKPAVSENKEVITNAADAPEVVFIMGEEGGVEEMCYHLKDCKAIKGKNAQDVTWEFVKTIGLWQCPECNPPRYEGYANGVN